MNLPNTYPTLSERAQFRAAYAPILALVALQAADIGTTIVGLAQGRREVGAVAGPALASLGLFGLIVVPLVLVAVQLAVLAIMPRPTRRFGWVAILVVACVPVISNLMVIA